MLCLYLCLRSLQAATDTSAFNWLVFAAFSNVLSGTVRQTSWLGVIVLVPSTLWLLRKRRISWVKTTLLWFSSLLCIYLCISWFQQQPYIERVSPMEDMRDRLPMLYIIKTVSLCVLSIPLLLLPVLAAFISPVWVKTRRSRFAVSIAVTALVAVVLAGFYWYPYHNEVLAPWGYNYVTQRGLIDIPDIGIRPTVLGPVVRIIITLLVFVAIFACAACISSSPVLYQSKTSTRNQAPSGRELVSLLAPFTLVYFALLLPRGAIGYMFDRYLLPLLVVAFIIVLRFYQQRVAARLPTFSIVCIFIVAAYSVAATHDFYSMERARLAAADEIRAAGVPRTAFYGGVGYDGWTEIDSWGYVKSSYVTLPPGPHRTPSWNLTLIPVAICSPGSSLPSSLATLSLSIRWPVMAPLVLPRFPIVLGFRRTPTSSIFRRLPLAALRTPSAIEKAVRTAR